MNTKTKPIDAPTPAGEVIAMPPVQVRRRPPALRRHLRELAERTIPAVLGLGLLVLLWQLAAVNSKGFPTPLSTLIRR